MSQQTKNQVSVADNINGHADGVAPVLENVAVGNDGTTADGAAPAAAAGGSPGWSKKEAEALRAKATAHAANLYLSLKRSGSSTVSVKDCCDRAALDTGYPRPAETSVRRLLPKLMTEEEKEEKKNKDKRGERRADATRRAAELYRLKNGDAHALALKNEYNHPHYPHSSGSSLGPAVNVVMSVTRACDTVEPEFGIRPAETSVRRLLQRMYEEEGIVAKSDKKKDIRKDEEKREASSSKKEKRRSGSSRKSSSSSSRSRKKAKGSKGAGETSAEAATRLNCSGEVEQQQQLQQEQEQFDELALAQVAAPEYFDPAIPQHQQQLPQQELLQQQQQPQQQPQPLVLDGVPSNLPPLPSLEEINDIVQI